MKAFSKLILAVILTCVFISPVWATRDTRDAVVKIYAVYNRYDYDEPWKMWGQERRSGSGCIISGRRVLTSAHVVGAFQGLSGENIGYMVPAPVINYFLEDITDGTYDGPPGLGISWQKMENPDLRLKYEMTENQSGVLVNKTYPDSPARGVLKPEDIILSIDGKNVENDGTVEFRKGERTFFGYLLQKKFINDKTHFEILREKNVLDIEITLSKPMNCGALRYHSFHVFK